MNELDTKIKAKLNLLTEGVSTKMYTEFTLVEWRPLLAKECQVYVYNESYLAKRFDQINYKFCSKETAKEILIDNLYALLRYKYFTKASDELEERINEIVKSFTTNLKTVLIRVSFDKDTECSQVKFLPDSCIAFRNGVFNFKENKWLFKYNKIKIDKLSNNIYLYDPEYIITWYVNMDFESLDIDITKLSLNEFIESVKELDKENKNYCFELMYNMSFDYDNKFSFEKFQHLCECLGYLCLQSFSQHFILFIGTGQNGKNSLFDGCFTSRIIPQPANNDLNSIEEDKFITGSLENKAHNIFLETDPDIKTKSKMLKALTGGMYQTIEHKGEDRYSGLINCKYVWAGNDQDKIKFSDNTIGFRRRINIFETYFRWDSQKRFLKLGEYYDTTFSEDLNELKNDILNTIIFIYFAMYGIQLGTENYTKSFRFTKNDWRLHYTDIDFDLKDKIESVSKLTLMNWFKSLKNRELGKLLFLDLNKRSLYLSDTIKEFGINNYDEFIDKFIMKDDDVFLQYFVEHDVFINLRILQDIIQSLESPRVFNQEFKKVYGVQTYNLTNNKAYAKVTFRNEKLKVLN